MTHHFKTQQHHTQTVYHILMMTKDILTEDMLHTDCPTSPNAGRSHEHHTDYHHLPMQHRHVPTCVPTVTTWMISTDTKDVVIRFKPAEMNGIPYQPTEHDPEPRIYTQMAWDIGRNCMGWQIKNGSRPEMKVRCLRPTHRTHRP